MATQQSATLIQGPIDALTQGLIAGTKIAALQANTQARKLQTTMLEKEINAFDERHQDEQDLAESLISARNARTAAADVQTETSRLLQSSLVEEQKLRVTSLKAGEARASAGSEQKLASERHKLFQDRLLSTADATPSFAESMGAAEVALSDPEHQKRTGTTFVPKGREHLFAALQHYTKSKELEQNLSLEEQKIDALKVYRQGQLDASAGRLGVSQQQADTSALAVDKRAPELSPEQSARVRMIEARLDALYKGRARVAPFGRAGADPESLKLIKELEAPFDKEIKVALRDFTKIFSSRPLTSEGDVIDSASGKVKLSEVRKGTVLQGREYIGPVPVTSTDFTDITNWKRK